MRVRNTVLRGGGSGLVAWPVFKTATEAPQASPVGSIPTRSRHHRSRPAVLAGLCAVLAVAPVVSAQEPVTPGDTTVFRRPPITPAGAFIRSALVPGWAQAALDRRLPAGLFIAWEAVTLGMSIKAHREVRYLKRIGAEGVNDKRQEREDWLILLAFNHLFSALEGFVGSHLWDFPEDVKLRLLPGPLGVVAAVGVPWRLR